MDKDDKRSDFNAKSILKNRRLIAPILKAVLVEYEDVSVEEIAEKYLPKNGQEIELLNSELVNPDEITTRYDIYFKAETPPKFGYNLIIDLEVQTTDEGISFVIRKIVYMGKLFSRQAYKLEELKEQAKEKGKGKPDFYPNLDHPVLLSLEWVVKKGRGNKILHTELNPVVVEYSDGLVGKIERVKELKPLPSELKAFALELFITICIDPEEKNPTGVFKYISEGLFNSTNPEKERLKIIEEFTGPLRKDDVKMLEAEWGTEEYIEQRGIKIGEDRMIEKFIESFKKQGMSKEEIQFQLKEVGLSYE